VLKSAGTIEDAASLTTAFEGGSVFVSCHDFDRHRVPEARRSVNSASRTGSAYPASRLLFTIGRKPPVQPSTHIPSWRASDFAPRDYFRGPHGSWKLQLGRGSGARAGVIPSFPATARQAMPIGGQLRHWPGGRDCFRKTGSSPSGGTRRTRRVTQTRFRQLCGSCSDSGMEMCPASRGRNCSGRRG